MPRCVINSFTLWGIWDNTGRHNRGGETSMAHNGIYFCFLEKYSSTFLGNKSFDFHRNRSMAPAPPTTPHPLFPVQQVKLNLVALPPSELRRSFCITYMLQPCAIKDPNALNHDNITDTTQTQKTNETHYQTSSGNHSCSTWKIPFSDI